MSTSPINDLIINEGKIKMRDRQISTPITQAFLAGKVANGGLGEKFLNYFTCRLC